MGSGCLLYSSVIFAALISVIVGRASEINGRKDFLFLGSRESYSDVQKEFIESNYYASAASGIWTQAADDCLQTFGRDGALVSIETLSEQEDLNRWLQERGSGGSIYWTSGLYEIDAGIWRWSGNQDYDLQTFTNWNGSAPVSPNSRQRIGLNHQNQFSALWMSFDDTNLERYICELKSADNVGTDLPPTPTVSTTEAPPTTPVQCPEPGDIAFILDSSSSVGAANFEIVKQFLAVLSSAFTSQDYQRVTVITYSEKVQLQISILNTMSPTEIAAEILAIPYIAGPRITDLGIKLATTELRSNYSGFPQTLIVVSNGLSSIPAATEAATFDALANGIRTFALGISAQADSEEMLIIAGNDPSHNFYAPEWTTVSSLIKDISVQLCPHDFIQ